MSELSLKLLRTEPIPDPDHRSTAVRLYRYLLLMGCISRRCSSQHIYKIKIPLSYDCRNRYEGPAGIQTLGRKRSNICIKILITEPIECGFHSNSWSQSQLSVVFTQTHDHRANWVSSHSNADVHVNACTFFSPFISVSKKKYKLNFSQFYTRLNPGILGS